MHMNLYKITKFLSISLIITELIGCASTIKTEEQSFNSTNITIPKSESIRVVVSSTIQSKNPFSNYQWSYLIQAKLYTEDMFLRLGYKVVDTGLAPSNTGHPTLIAIVNTPKETTALKLIHYQMSLYRPLTTNNELFSCRNTQKTSNLCIAPQIITNAQELFKTQCTYTGYDNIASFVIDYCVKSAFTTFPTGSHKNIIYSTNSPPQISDIQNYPR